MAPLSEQEYRTMISKQIEALERGQEQLRRDMYGEFVSKSMLDLTMKPVMLMLEAIKLNSENLAKNFETYRMAEQNKDDVTAQEAKETATHKQDFTLSRFSTYTTFIFGCLGIIALILNILNFFHL